MLVLELFWLLQALDLTAPRSYPFIVEASTNLVGLVLLFIPLQAGVSEGTYALIFGVMGLPAAVGFAFAFLRRGRSLILAGVGLATLARLSSGRNME